MSITLHSDFSPWQEDRSEFVQHPYTYKKLNSNTLKEVEQLDAVPPVTPASTWQEFYSDPFVAIFRPIGSAIVVCFFIAVIQ